MASQLLLLPPELRLQIWELLLAPSPRNDSFTTVSRMCSTQLGSTHGTAVSHDWECDCSCHARSFYLLDSNKSLCPALLQVNRQIYEEALPCLYRNRAFSTDPNRTYETLHDKICDSWFLMDRFLAGLAEKARLNIRGIKLSMLLSKFEVYGSRQAFYSIASRLPALKIVHLEVCPSSVRETSNDTNDPFIHHLSEIFPTSKYWLGPVMAFDASIKIIMAGKNDCKKDPTMTQALPTNTRLFISSAIMADAKLLREKGNAFYKEGKLSKAADSYIAAWNRNKSDPAPLGNLSAARFELGEFNRSIVGATKALSLYGDGEEAKKQRLYSRIAKSNIYSLKLEPNSWNLIPREVQDEFKDSVSTLNDVWTKYPHEAKIRSEILERLPRYRPALNSTAEFYSFGHDDARPWDDGETLLSGPDNFAFMFCGIGDARQFYATLAHCAARGLEKTGLENKRYHFTLADIKGIPLARDLIIFLLLDELSQSSEKAEHDILVTIFYVYVATIMPAAAYDKMQDTITKIIELLEDRAEMPTWLFVPKHDRPALLKHLHAWQTSIAQKWTVKAMRRTTILQVGKDSINRANMFGHLRSPDWEDVAPAGCERERSLFYETGMVQPPSTFLESHEPKLLAILSKLKKRKTNTSKSLEPLQDYLDQNWRHNVTFEDFEFQQDRRDRLDFGDPDVGHDPFEIGGKFYNESRQQKPSAPGCLYDYAAPFFKNTATALKHLKGRFVVELVIGEMADFFERLRYDQVPHRQEKTKQHDATKFPRQYHRVHMSNIPDYIGGHLTSFLYALPILSPEQPSYITSNCLRNTTRFTSVNKFTNEYTITNTTLETIRLMGTTISPHSPLLALMWSHFDYGDGPAPDDFQFPMGACDYLSFKKWDSKIPFERLIKKAQVEKWLYAHFFKIVYPHPRAVWEQALIEAPLNLTAFFRILVHLHEMGYPGHWLAEVVSSILTGLVTTTARAPRSMPLALEEARKDFPNRRTCVKAFVPEFSTLTLLWQRLLPFGVITDALPRLDEVCEFVVELFKPVGRDAMTSLNAALVFFDTSLGAPPKDLRPLLLDDEKGEMSVKARKVREEGVVVVSTFAWGFKSRRASFWLRKDVIEGMRGKGKWKVYLWRTDVWEKVTDGVSVDKVEERRTWV
ncbi:hypothetical protein EG328_010229 [Venturia inaequalis]|uniref:DUF4470 domain-containing protein n=1 Tax=Venturia inaequalis TaxID=5025 RepID=A0A8H3V863_VENIN|nr:hypothetical protein EG328_010229 [Venturia inaequalis]